MVGTAWKSGVLSATLAPILAVTLSPAGESDTVGGGLFCVVCGTAGMANLLRNVILFVPFGAALRAVGTDARRASLLVLAITAGIESSQFFIPGRNPGLIDLWANFSGGVVGHIGAGAVWTWLGAGRRKARSIVAVWSVLATLSLLATSQLFRIEVSESVLYGHHRPQLGHLAEYEGQVLWATVGDLALSQGPLPDPERIRSALSTGTVVRAAATTALSPDALAPLVMITNSRYEEVLLLGSEGPDLVFRIRYLADDLRLHRPELRFRGALQDVPPGDTVVVGWDSRRDTSCLSVDGVTRCGIGPYLEEAWSLLLAPAGLPSWMQSALNFAWMFGLFFPIGLFGRRDLVTAAAFAVLTIVSFSGWWISSISPPTLVGVAGIAAGSVAGVMLYRLFLRFVGR